MFLSACPLVLLSVESSSLHETTGPILCRLREVQSPSRFLRLSMPFRCPQRGILCTTVSVPHVEEQRMKADLLPASGDKP